jgi:hypothetical protein
MARKRNLFELLSLLEVHGTQGLQFLVLADPDQQYTRQKLALTRFAYRLVTLIAAKASYFTLDAK